jgi:hypothetical protein
LGVSDNDGIASVTNNAPATYPIGTTIVTWIVTDNSGNVTTVQQTVIVLDKEPPVINGPANLIVTTDAGVTTASGVNIGDPSVSDNDTVVTIVNDAPLVYHLGINIVKWTATDRYGNVTSQNQTITVLDKEKPVVTINNITVNTDNGSNKATNVNLGTPVTTDNHSVTVVQNNALSAFPIGTTIVKWTVKDSSGNTTTADQLVTVIDVESPVIVTPPAAIIVLTDASKNFATGVQLGSPIVTDNSGGVVTKTNDAPATFPMGTTLVTWTVTDGSGNTTRLQQPVTVLDKEAPSISIANISIDAAAGLCAATPASIGTPSVTDNHSVVSITNDAPTTFLVGNTTVKWTATDSSGNSRSVLQTVTVVDRQLPVITAPADISVTPTTVIPVIVLGTPVVSDNCGIRSVTNNAPASFPLGLTTVIWTVTDVNGNISTAVQTVNILGQIPIITAPANVEACDDLAGNQKQLSLSISNNFITSVTYKISGATTVLAGIGTTISRSFNVGVSTIEWTVIDNYGNITKKTATVTINPLPTVSINTPGADALCTNVTVSANSTAVGATYKWMFGALTVGTASTLNLTAANADGTYTVSVTDGKGCKSTTSASYVFTKQNLGNMYTLYAFKSIKLHHNNLVNGSIGVRDDRGSIDINRYTTVVSPGFVKAAIISVDKTSIVPNKILAPAIITLPTMQYYTGNALLYNSTTVNQNTTVTLNGNYRDIKINKGANVTLTGTLFRTITIDEGAVVTFTSPVINIEDLNVGRGPNTGYTYVNFATDASVRIGKSVTVQERSIVNAAAKQVTFYLGDMSPDVENFMVQGGDNKIIANIYIPNGKLHVNGGCNESFDCERNNHVYGYHNCQNGVNNTANCNGNDHGNDYPNNACPPTIMTGFFIAESIQSTGKNVIWNGYNCLAAAPATTRQITNTVTTSLPDIKTLVVSATVDAKDVSADKTLKLEVYPVPTRGLFDVRLHNVALGNAKVEVVAANGVIADAKTINVTSKTTTVNFNLTNKSQGNYYVRVIASDGKQIRTTILIAR